MPVICAAAPLYTKVVPDPLAFNVCVVVVMLALIPLACPMPRIPPDESVKVPAPEITCVPVFRVAPEFTVRVCPAGIEIVLALNPLRVTTFPTGTF